MSDLELHGLEISEDNVEKLQEMLGDPERRWYGLRRLKGFQTVGLVAGSYWNPELHPRGPDGKFIEKWGFVRWLVDGLWQRGRVENLLPDNKIIVAPDGGGDEVVLSTKQTYALPTPKGQLVNSPDPTSYSVPTHWEKTGEQGGSNPGGFYTSQEKIPVRSTPSVEQIQQVVFAGGDTGEFDEYDWKEMEDTFKKAGVGQPDRYIAHYTGADGKSEVLFRNGADPLTVEWDAATKANDLKLWVTTSELALGEARVKLTRGMDVEEGTQFYVKQTKSVNHAANEMLANELYKLAGVPVPDLYFGQHQTVASKILKSSDPDGIAPQMLSKVKDDSAVLAQIRPNMAVDAWLANWDVAGMTYDNIIVVDGIPYRIDTGGSLEYRAQGGPKGGAFGHEVGELKSYLNTSLNPSASTVFAGITPDELRSGAEKVAAISPRKIKDMVRSAGISDAVGNTLVARRESIIEQVGVHDPYKIYVPPQLTKVTKGTVPEEKFWNPIDDQWQPGILLKSSADARRQVEGQIISLYGKGDPELAPIKGDLIVVGSQDAFTGMFRVTDDSESMLKAVSALDPDNKTEYELYTPDVRIVSETDPAVEEVRSAYTQHRVATVNDQLKLHTLDSVFDVAVQNKDVSKPPVYLVPHTYGSEGDAMFKMQPGQFLFHGYEDFEGEHKVVYRINGTTADSISMTNVIDGKERILSWDEWVADYEPSQWSIPDDYTQDQTLALLQRDKLISTEDNLEAISLEYPYALDEYGEAVDISVNPDLPGPSASLEELGAVPTMTNDYGIHNDIPTGEVVPLNDLLNLVTESLDMDSINAMPDGVLNVETPLHEFLGQSVIIGNPDAKRINLGYTEDYRGLFYVDGIEVRKRAYGHGTVITTTMSMIAPNGQRQYLRVEEGKTFGEQVITIATALDASIPSPPPSLRENGDIVLEKQIIGRWEKGGTWRAEIFPEHSLTGTTKIVQAYAKYEMRDRIVKHVIPLLQPTELVPKSGKTEGSKDAILSKAVFKRREDFPAGSWVIAPDGFTGVVGVTDSGIGSNASFLSRFPSAVRVTNPVDGKTRIINANLLLPTEAPEVTETESDLVSLSEVKAMTDSGAPFFPLKLKDGTDPRIGQYVRAFGPGEKITEGTINWVGPPDGKQAKVAPLLSIVTADGKIVRKTLSKTVLLKDVEGAPTPPIAESGLPEDTKAAVEAVIGFTPEATSDIGMKYVAPDGKTLAQPQWEKDVWLGKSPKRTLTKDGYAPRAGMRVQTNKGEALVILGFEDVYKRPNNVQTLNLTTGQTRTRVVSALTVDHAAELGDVEYGSLDYVRGITLTSEPDATHPSFTEHLPNGTIIYKATASKNYYTGEAYRKIDEYFFITETGQIQKMGGGGHLSQQQAMHWIAELSQMGQMSKVAVIDENSPNFGGYTNAVEKNPAAFVVYSPSELTHEEALSGHFLELTGVSVKGAEIAAPIPKDNLVSVLPKPADAIDMTEDELVPDPPPITGTVGAVNDKPGILPVKSVTEAGLEILSQKLETSPGSGSEYAFGDQEYIEDMLVRAQIAKDVKSGNEYVEFHFRMLESKAEATSDRLVTAGKNVTYGKWQERPEPVRGSHLEIGDAISVRVSSVSDALKPSNGTAPNARVIADPVLLGADSKGVPIYRVTVASADGTTGAMDVQERALPSIKVYDWNPAAVATMDTSATAKLTSKAITNGWREVGDLGYDFHGKYASKSPVVSMDETGAKLIDGDSIHMGATGDQGKPGARTQGRRLERTFPDGSYVRYNAIPSSISGTSHGGNGGSPGEARRFNEAGQVTIRVPVSLEYDPEAFQASVSRAMEAVGIPPDKQGPPTDEHLAVFALNKLFKTHAADFAHRSSPVTQPSTNDPKLIEVLARMDKELMPILGRPVTLDDISIHVFSDGRFTALLSAEVASAISKRQGNQYYQHSGVSTTDKIVELLAGPNPGLMGGTERYSMGLFFKGASTERDMTKGSGNRVYLKPRQTESAYGGVLVYSADAINRSLDIYNNYSDGFGARADVNRLLTSGGGHETMMKDKIEVEQLAYYMADGPSTRTDIIDRVKAKGVTHINGRPIEEIVVVNAPVAIGSPEFQKFGTTLGTEVTVAQILGIKTGAKLPSETPEPSEPADLEEVVIPPGGIEGPF